MSPYKRLVNNIGVLLVSKGFNVLLSLVTISLVARYLSVELFGKYSFAMDFVFVFVAIIKLGLSQIITRQIAQHKSRAGADISAVIYIRIFVALLCTVIVVMINSVLDLSREAEIAIYLALASEIIFSFVSLSTDVFVAFERAKYVPLIMITNRIFVVAGIFSVVYMDAGFYSLIIVSIIVNFLAAIAGVYLTLKKFVRIDLSFDMGRIKYFLREAYPVAIAAFLIEMSFRMDSFFLKGMADYNEVAFFGVPLKIVSRLMFLSFAVTEAVLPVFSKFYQSSKDDLVMVFGKVLKLLNVLVFPICAFIIFSSREIIVFVFGDKFIPSIPSLQLFMPVYLCFSLVILMGNVLISMNRQRLVAFTMLLGIVVNAFLDILLIPSYGHVGASLAKAISFSAMLLFIMGFVVKNLGPFRIHENMLKPLFNTLLAFLVASYIKDFNYVLSIAGGVTSYVLGLYVFKISSIEEMHQFRDIMGKTDQ